MPYALRIHTETCTPDCTLVDYWLREDGTFTTNKKEAQCFRDQNLATDAIIASETPLKMEDWK